MKRRNFIKAVSAAALGILPLESMARIVNGKESKDGINIVALCFDEYETLDLHGPLEMFGHMPNVNIKLIGKTEIIRSYQKTSLLMDDLSDSYYKCDLFIIPGGLGTRPIVNREDSTFFYWLREQCEMSERVFTVCTGSALLAKTGLLSDRQATTNKQAFDWVSSLDRRVHWQKSARWVTDGKYTTSSGVSAGIDASLAIVEDLVGTEERDRIIELTEYVWNSDPTFDPFAIK